MEAPVPQPVPISKPTRRRRTDADRLADMQAELARLKAAGEAKAIAEVASQKPKRATQGRPKPKHRDDSDLESELRDLVEGFVAALRDVIRRELVAQATKSSGRAEPLECCERGNDDEPRGGFAVALAILAGGGLIGDQGAESRIDKIDVLQSTRVDARKLQKLTTLAALARSCGLPLRQMPGDRVRKSLEANVSPFRRRQCLAETVRSLQSLEHCFASKNPSVEVRLMLDRFLARGVGKLPMPPCRISRSAGR
jgi:hypothetical protein